MAGGRQFPLLFARAARANGVRVFAVAHEGETSPELGELVEAVEWVKVGQLRRILKFFKANGISEAVMAGSITKVNIFRNFRPDTRALAMAARLRHMNDDHLLRTIAAEFEKDGIAIRPSTLYTPQLLAPEGLLTKRAPSKEEQADIEFGWRIAKELGRLDIGQCVVVRNLSVLAVEAIEGTDEALKRGGALGKEKSVAVKVSKPTQDMRFDVPTVGAQTVKVMAGAGVSALAVEAGRTLIFDLEEMIAEANRAGITIVARNGE